MAKTPPAVEQFLGRLIPPATANARAEARDIQALIDAQGGGFQLEPWDWDFYAEQVRKAKYDLDSAALAPYFELDRVLHDGVFFAAQRALRPDRSRSATTCPVYQPDVRVFEVIDHDGSSLALFYCDLFARDNKNGGAWMDNFVVQSTLLGTKPVVYNVANFAKPAPGQPALLSLDDVMTMFHEFGHALHGLFAEPAVSEPLGHERGPRLRRAAVAVQRALGARADGARALRRAPQDRRADAAGPRRQDQEGGDLQPGLQPDGDSRRRRARHAVALAGAQAARTAADAFEAAALAVERARPARRCRRATGRATSCTSGPTATRRATTRTCGPRCSTTTPSRGSPSTAG